MIYNSLNFVQKTLDGPDCGRTGTISSKPSQIQEEIPEKKSIHKNFTCTHCGEWMMVWAEGVDIVQNVHVYSCPYCSIKQDLHLT